MKKWLAVLLAAMMVFCLAACGDKDEEKKSKKSDSDSKSVSAEDKEDKEDNDNGNASAVEKSRIKTDEANARCLKSLLATSYMGDDAFDTSATYYLTSDGMGLQTSTNGAIEYTSDKYKANGYVSGTCSADGIVTVNCEGIYENSVPYEPDDEEDAGLDAATEKGRIMTDEANARCLKSLIVALYLSEPDTFDTSATYFLSNDGKSCQTSSFGAMEYTSEKYSDGLYISGTCDENGLVTINCEGIS